MQHGKELNLEELRGLVREAVSKSGKTQRAIAEELKVSPGAVSRALNEKGTALTSLQRSIIEHLTQYKVEVETVYRLVREEK
jgi:predicted transcriptional regulator